LVTRIEQLGVLDDGSDEPFKRGGVLYGIYGDETGRFMVGEADRVRRRRT
jgi:hypothetical protein